MTTKQVIAMATTVTAILTALALIGLDVPMFASQSYVQEHARDNEAIQRGNDGVHIKFVGELRSAKALALENAIAREELRAGNLEIQAAQLKAAGADASAMEGLARDLRKSVAKRERELLKLED